MINSLNEASSVKWIRLGQLFLPCNFYWFLLCLFSKTLIIKRYVNYYKNI